MTLSLSYSRRDWPMREPFAIARGVQTHTQTLMVVLTDAEGRRGRGEACGVLYAGETPDTMATQLEAVRADIERGVTREALLDLLPAGGARCAVDAALWDLEARRRGLSAFEIAGVGTPRTLETAFTIGIRSTADYEIAARAHADFATLKIKVDGSDPVSAVRSARSGAPQSAFIVDPNQSWSVETLKTMAPILADLGVVLLEQPIPVGAEAGLDGYHCPIPLCADELVNDAADLMKAKGRFQVVNIKLDKAGGLTAALDLAARARAAGFDLMAGCMAGSSLSMAPALVLAQQCAFVDLDGPLLQAEDWEHGLTYASGRIEGAAPGFWG